ncbi:proteophosphoglycan 5 [Rhodotorula toruloides]|uniref:Proteophosphoglycan 5 n=1 Tax=Rhodotorula toruloides TaxID=5286 RepID=A0A511KGE3_RHOTO|nr:proteophosphoglycan 5 [Rhodotorula toruloides]
MPSRTGERTDHVDLLAAILQVHRLLAGFEHAFVGLAETIVRLSSVFQQTIHLEHFPERDEFLKRRWLVPDEHLVVHVKPYQFVEACEAVGVSPVRHIDSSHPVATFAVYVTSTYQELPRTVIFHFDLAKQVDPPIQRDGSWSRDVCSIYIGHGQHQTMLDIPAERGVYAVIRRLRPLYDLAHQEIDAGFSNMHHHQSRKTFLPSASNDKFNSRSTDSGVPSLAS